MQADVSLSETASAVTCVSEKSGNTLNDTASTRALAGSICRQVIVISLNCDFLFLKMNHQFIIVQQMDSSNISEDGVSERVRFDNVCYVIDDNKKDNNSADVWSTSTSQQDHVN